MANRPKLRLIEGEGAPKRTGWNYPEGAASAALTPELLDQCFADMLRRDAMPICPRCYGVGLTPGDLRAPSGRIIGYSSRLRFPVCRRCGGSGRVVARLVDSDERKAGSE